jgi:uncharacterized protein YhfF
MNSSIRRRYRLTVRNASGGTGQGDYLSAMSGRETTPLPEMDTEAADVLWQRFLVSVDGDPSSAYTDLGTFGDSVELADELLALVLEGRKRATAGSVAEYEIEGFATPQIGDRWIVCDGRGRPRVVLETTDVRVGPLSSVDDQFAWDEGEGDRTRADWLEGHTTYFTRSHTAAGIPFHPDIPVVFERFEVLYQVADSDLD